MRKPDDRPSWPEHFSGRRPPWWPENEPWPPRRGWPMHRGPFFRRLGCLFGAFSLFGLVFFFVIIGLILNSLGITQFNLESLRWVLPIGGVSLVLILAMLIVIGRNLRRLSAPLDDMLGASNRVAEGDYSARVDEKGPPEIRSLARGFNSMAARLQSNDQQRRNMLADVSHELRTPLTVIRGNVEGMLDGLYPADEKTLKSILEETQLLSRLVDDLRTLSLAESGALQLRREAIDLAALITETSAGFSARADEGGVQLEVDAAAAPPVHVDPVRIREVLSNLISNALRYTPPGGRVCIRYEDSRISVEDDGPGIEVGDLPHIFERFYKSSDSHGMGLGLSIAKYLVEAHGGEMEAASRPGSGTTISFTLPRQTLVK